MNQSEKFLQEIDELSQRISDSVMIRAKRSLIDYLAVTCAGAKYQSNKLSSFCTFSLPEAGEFCVVGTKLKLALKEAVFLNGLNSHSLDFDDGTNSGIIHLGSPIFSLLIPLAQRYHIKTDALLKAAVLGYEVSYTLAITTQPRSKNRGYHATGTCGVVGATIAATYLLGFNEEERFNAFSAACVSASGVLKALDDNSELKPYNVAKAALLALTSIQMAKAGFTGNDDPLGGRGFLKMMTGQSNLKLKGTLKNGTFAIEKSYTKPYASCRYTHPSVEAAIYLRNTYGLKPDDVTKIEIKTYGLAVYGHDHTEIRGSYSAKMSIPFATAVGLFFGCAGLSEFSEETVKNEKLLALTQRIHVSEDEDLSRDFPKVQTAIVDIYSTKGKISHRVDYPKGEPENPLSEVEFRERYTCLMKYGGVNKADKIYDIIQLKNVTVKEILDLL